MRILIAEDDPVSRRLLQATLTKLGHEVVVAGDGKEAWQILKSEDTPRLAILDWMMPGMDGVQVCQEVRKGQQEPYIYIILLTAKDQKQDILKGFNAGADDYVVKPFDMQELGVRLNAGIRILDLQTRLYIAQQSLEKQATHDVLTGLPNRLLFSDRLTQKLHEAKRSESMLAVMFLDLDHFKMINDTLGHSVGDLLLTQVSERLTKLMRESDTVARMGGDEFTVLLPDIESPKKAAAVARRVLDSLCKPYSLNGREHFVSVSIGIGLYPSDGNDVETLVRNADTAMYRAKEKGRNRWQLFTESLNSEAARRMKLANDLHRALTSDEFVLHYQPRVDLGSREILGVEALIRWRQQDSGLVYPGDFIQAAEENGLIIPLTQWVLKTACEQNKVWQEMGFAPIEVAVNISAHHFREEGLVEDTANACKDAGLEPKYLTLELTEGTLMHSPEMAIETLKKLRKTGAKIAIDDFGTGYSSLSYLKRFPADCVKIDRSFVRDISLDPDDAAIAAAIVAMAHSMKLKVVAEGVETLEQLNFLRSLKCDEMQGYFISRAVPADEITQLLEQTKKRVGKAA